MALTWAGFDRLVHEGDTRGVFTMLLEADEAQRRAFGAELESRIRSAAPAGRGWGRQEPGWSPASYALAVIACAPTAARAAALLSRREMRQWHTIHVDRFLELARARQLPWVGELGVRLAQRSRPGDIRLVTEWEFLAALFDEGKADPPVTEAVVASWLRQMHTGRPAALLRNLRASPFLDRLLPGVFAIDGLGAHVRLTPWDGEPASVFSVAVARLCAEGRLDRTSILAATVDRLLRGDRPAALRPFARLHEELAPAPSEMVPLATSYLRLLAAAPSPVAGLAQRASRSAWESGELEWERVLEVSGEVLARPEKALVKAQLSWLDRVARRDPAAAGDVVAVVEAASESPVLDIRELARAVAERHRPAPTAASPALRAPVAGEAQPASSATPLVSDVHRSSPAAVIPAAIGSAAELAEEFVALLRERTAVRWERVMAALVGLPAEGLGEALEPVLNRNDRTGRTRFTALDAAIRALDAAIRALDAAIRARAGLPFDPHEQQRLHDVVQHPRSLVHTPADLLDLRLAEIAVRVTRSPIPELLATPTHLTGSLDAGVLIDRLTRLEAAGAEPWPLDFQQALLRVAVPQPERPAEDAGILARADALTGPHGRRLAAWLRAGGLPQPISIRFEQRHPLSPDRRVVVNLQPGPGDLSGLGDLTGLSGLSGRPTFGGLGGLGRAGDFPEDGDRGDPEVPGGLEDLDLEDAVVSLSRAAEPDYQGWLTYRPDVLAMVLPHHREAAAAWALPDLAALADQDDRDASLLPLLADAGGPPGPAVALAVAYGLGARHAADRVAAIDAFLALTERPGAVTVAAGDVLPSTGPSAAGFAAAVGAELGDLCSDGTVKLARVVEALTDAQVAGATGAVWQLLTAALPRLLPAGPRGLPDMLQLATLTVTAGAAETGGGATAADIPGLEELARRSGGSRLLREARRLVAALGKT
ncbi:hypothetical protein AMIS_54780 [Actinoplanes missouriensis 431]|uniref:Secreted protein n=1 Tax=Actinoplanes missouriensis (strain ATCC 14538 / DSM 43046 / CBS 188.64 / JCM 3121 / NBRC 102363 / NCIMB 12654 / NRRL B-3342 / UNCC 431) TaxID=512565 RepID=I0HCG1_ACTM4|nr:DUF6493 family protein [Actinoplanes missouriensis]BAL90698.1 hypothetical protein AMIS_54780 [Actinoplanes missouriensis 431]